MRDWQGGVLELVRNRGPGPAHHRPLAAYGLNGIGLMVMVVVFASTAGLTGAEVGVAGGTALLAQKMLEAVFGDQAVRGAGGPGPRRACSSATGELTAAEQRAATPPALARRWPAPADQAARRRSAAAAAARRVR